MFSIYSVSSDDEHGKYSKYYNVYHNNNKRTALSRSQISEARRAIFSQQNQSLFIHSSSLHINLNLYEKHLVKHSFHSSAYLTKEDTVVEKSLKNLKEKEKNLKDKVKSKDLEQVKQNRFRTYAMKIYAKWQKLIIFLQEEGFRGVLKHLWEGMKFYKDGLKLFWKDLRICIPLSYKYLKSGRSTLTRREYRLVSNYCILGKHFSCSLYTY